MSYRTRVLADLSRWQEAGWLTLGDDGAIEEDLKGRGRRIGIVAAAVTLGAILIGMAAITFVAANWSLIPRIARLVLLVSSFSAAYAIAGWLMVKGRHWFAGAAALAGVIIFGASINLVAQMYNISGNPPTVALVWTGAALVASLAFRSPLNFGAAILLAALWGFWQMAATSSATWGLPPLLAGLAVMAWWKGWLGWASLGLLAVLVAWSLATGVLHAEAGALWWLAGFGLSTAILCGYFAHIGVVLRDIRIWRIVTAAFIIGFAGLLLRHIAEDPDLALFIVLAVASLVVAIGAVAAGIRLDIAHLLWAGYLAFGVEVAALYFKTFGTLIETSLFFLIAGVLLILFALTATRLQRLASGLRRERT